MAEHDGRGQPVRRQPRGEPGQPLRARLGQSSGRRVQAEADRCGVPGPGDHRTARTRLGVQRPRHARRSAVHVTAPVEGPGVDVRPRYDDRHMTGGAEVPEHLGDLAAPARIEGEDLPAGRGERGVPGVVRGAQSPGVGAVAELQRHPVQIADHRRVPLQQLLLLGGAQPAEETVDLRRARTAGVGQLPPQHPVVTPRGTAGRRTRHRPLGVPGRPAGRPRHHGGRQCDRGQCPREPAHRALPVLLAHTGRCAGEEGRKTAGDRASPCGANCPVIPG